MDKYSPVPFAAIIQFLPEKVVLPLLVQIGEQDQAKCPGLLEKQKTEGAPVEFLALDATYADVKPEM